MYDKMMSHRLLAALNADINKFFIAFGAAIGVVDWSVGGTFVSGALLALRMDVKGVVFLQIALLILGMTAKSRNPTTRRLSYGDAVNVTGWLSATFIATTATMLGLAPVAFLCYIWTASSCVSVQPPPSRLQAASSLMIESKAQQICAHKFDYGHKFRNKQQATLARPIPAS